jgi:putative FmdB family regulatory protein
MPLYEYQCQQCGRRSEALQKMAAAPLTTCEACGGPLKRLVSSPAVQFKGSGWYVTDYARKSGANQSGGGAAAKGDAGGEGKAEPKSESKGEGAAKASGDGGGAEASGGGSSTGTSSGSGGSSGSKPSGSGD